MRRLLRLVLRASFPQRRDCRNHLKATCRRSQSRARVALTQALSSDIRFATYLVTIVTTFLRLSHGGAASAKRGMSFLTQIFMDTMRLAACGFGPGRYAKGTGKRKQWACPKCRNKFVRLVLGFSFWHYDMFLDAVEDAEEDPESIDVFNHPEDFFNEVFTFAYCPSCRAKTKFTDIGKL